MTNKEKHENNIYIPKTIMPENFEPNGFTQTSMFTHIGDEIYCPYCKKKYTVEKKDIKTYKQAEAEDGLMEAYLQKKFLFFKYKKKFYVPMKMVYTRFAWCCPICNNIELTLGFERAGSKKE